jgi:hypothetical protein
MTSYSGSVAYLEYVAKDTKGGVNAGDVLNSVFGFGANDEGRMSYTSQIVVEEGETPSMEVVNGGLTYIAEDGVDVKTATKKFILDDGTVAYDAIPEGKTAKKVAYVAKQWQMSTIPADRIPTIGPRMKRIPLVAEPRRIAVRYDQITAFQAKTDYGFSLDKQIAEQACGELAFEIDTEIVDMLYKAAFDHEECLEWSKTLPVGVSKFEHYNGFLEVVEEAKMIIYNRTRKFHPNYMVIAADVLPVLKFVNGFSAVKNAKMNGPYKVGEIDGMDVYVSPLLKSGDFFLGLNGSDMMSSAGVYAPYMAIVPTALLSTPDGGMAQGFSTWYAKALLNKNLLVAGRITK